HGDHAARPGASTHICLVRGRLNDPARLAAELGLPPETPVARLVEAGYTRWQAQLLARLSGEFALVVTDPATGSTLLAVDPLGYGPVLTAPPGELAEALRGEIETAVRTRLPATGSVGVLLSGGLDSATVAAVAEDLERRRRAEIRAYSALFPDHPSVDESSRIHNLTTGLGVSSWRVAVGEGSMRRHTLGLLGAWLGPGAPP